MALFKAYSPKVEVNGETVLSIVSGMGAFKAHGLKILKESGIDSPKPGEWYSQQAWLNSFKIISEKLGDATLGMIGKSIPKNAKWPPQIDSVEKALPSIDVAYHMNHRNGEIGHYAYESTGKRSGKMVCNNPYPDAFDMGIIESAGEIFSKKGDSIKVTQDSKAPSRSKGADSSTFLIEW